MATTTRMRVDVGGRVVELSNLDKVLWPDVGYTKADLIEYYASIAPVLLPYLRDRPLSLTRHPDGIDGHSFYQKNAPDYAPEWMRTYPVGRDDDVTNYMLADDVAALVWLANQACIGIHPWLSTVHSQDMPDQIVIDLDPNPPAQFEEARRVAFVVKDVLTQMDLRAYPKVSGATGIHIYIPVVPQHRYSVTSAFAGLVGRIVAELIPEEATNERPIQHRGARVYVDHLQNLPGQTIVAPYSVRPRPEAPVSTPVTWDELRHCRPEDFTMKTVPARVRRVGNLFAPVLTDFQNISAWTDELDPSSTSLS